MNGKADKFWTDAAANLRRAKRLHALTPEEAQAQLDAAQEVPLSEEEIESVIDAATSGELTTWTPTPHLDWAEDFDTAAVADDVLQLNRNRGEEDPEVEQLLDELRREALNNNEVQREND
jgi:hypothetical protein